MDLPFLGFDYDFQLGYEIPICNHSASNNERDKGKRLLYLMELERTLVHCWMVSNQI